MVNQHHLSIKWQSHILRRKDSNPTPHGDNNGVLEKMKIIVKAINADPTVLYSASAWGYQLAINAKNGTLNKTPIQLETDDTNFNADEFELNVRQYTLGTSGTGNFSTPGQSGDDGDAPEVDDYLGNENDQTGFYALDVVDLFNLMVLPSDQGVSESAFAKIVGPASTYCVKERAFLLARR